MKTLFNIFFALVLFSAASFAGNNPEGQAEFSVSEIGILSNQNQDRVVVALENDTNAPYWVSIEDAEGNTLHSETIQSEGYFNKRFDLGELGKGEYTVKVGQGSDVASKETLVRK